MTKGRGSSQNRERAVSKIELTEGWPFVVERRLWEVSLRSEVAGGVNTPTSLLFLFLPTGANKSGSMVDTVHSIGPQHAEQSVDLERQTKTQYKGG